MSSQHSWIQTWLLNTYQHTIEGRKGWYRKQVKQLLPLDVCLKISFLSNVKVILTSWVLVAHAYNFSYSGGRDQEDCSLKSAPG
jgi:hypothetical protein